MMSEFGVLVPHIFSFSSSLTFLFAAELVAASGASYGTNNREKWVKLLCLLSGPLVYVLEYLPYCRRSVPFSSYLFRSLSGLYKYYTRQCTKVKHG